MSPTGEATGSGGEATGGAGATGGNGTAGTTSVSGTAGTTSAGGSIGTGGGGGSTGGSSGTAGVGVGGHGGTGGVPPCACPALACKAGYQLMSDPASCCPVCKPIVCNGACAIPQCDPSSHLEKAVGQCCATCMPGPDPACAKGQAAYAVFHTELVDKYTSGSCNDDSDCALFFENNRCAVSCGTAVSANLAMDATANLDQAAQMDCGTCPLLASGGACPAIVALCSNGMCVTGAGVP